MSIGSCYVYACRGRGRVRAIIFLVVSGGVKQKHEMPSLLNYLITMTWQSNYYCIICRESPRHCSIDAQNSLHSPFVLLQNLLLRLIGKIKKWDMIMLSNPLFWFSSNWISE